MGNSIGHFDISKIKKEIKTLTAIKKLGLYHLLKLSIKIRESSFIKYTKKDKFKTAVKQASIALIIALFAHLDMLFATFYFILLLSFYYNENL